MSKTTRDAREMEPPRPPDSSTPGAQSGTVQSDFHEFALKVAHDLREPLRSVGVYCQLLANRRDESSEEESKLYLGYILDGVERAQALLVAMVEYASLDEPKRMAPVDMNAVFWEGLKRAQLTQADITHDQLPSATGELETLAKVMAHLLDNALKYNRSPNATAHVSARRNPDAAEWIFSVRDNGAGIDPAHHERIFALFKRLHGRDYPGIGLGLSYARRALEPMGGRIWVESQPGAGATFYFTLPAAD